ncbi:hypothetical protein [Shewanella inventionis]|uniref:hypothetical protein n=1 Tax=Shewanella inventionis TaxID=1738770 RepID=UPI00166D3AC5|nr:hypothetical protein [Shewanella inventionis]MCL1159994.1 hypothetical protein [Shewanella inventionis]
MTARVGSCRHHLCIFFDLCRHPQVLVLGIQVLHYAVITYAFSSPYAVIPKCLYWGSRSCFGLWAFV